MEQLVDDGARVILLDLHQVHELPNHLMALLLDASALFGRNGAQLVISRGQHLHLETTATELTKLDHVHQQMDLDLALELSESLLLEAFSPGVSACEQNASVVLQQLEPAHLARLEALLKPLQVIAGERVFRRGDDSDRIYFVDRGRLTTFVSVPLSSDDLRQARVATVTDGMCFGEIAFLSGQPRTVDVIAERDSQCRVLHRSDFEYLRQENPETAIQLLMALAGELGWRLSRTTRQLTVLQQL